MKKTTLVIIFCSLAAVGFSQIKNPVKWTFSVKKINATAYELHLSAAIENSWHIYSQTTTEGGPIPTEIKFTKNPLVNLDGSVAENGKLEKKFEKLFGVEVIQFSDKVDFIQKVKLKNGIKTFIKGTVQFMVCNDKECLPPSSQSFSIQLK